MKFTLYLIIALIFSMWSARKSDRPFLGFIFIFWITTKSVINGLYPVNLGFFTLSPNRLLFLACIGYLFFSIGMKQNSNGKVDFKKTSPLFEKILISFPVIILIAFVANAQYFSWKSLCGEEISIIIFLTVYFTAKTRMTPRLLDSILQGMIVFSIFSALLVIFQFAVNQDFMRVGEPKLAFGNIYRAYGLFEYDGELGFFQSLCLILLFVRHKVDIKTLIFSGLLLVSILLTFHRLSYLTCSIAFFTFFFLYNKNASRGVKAVALFMIPVTIFLLLAAYQLLGSGGGANFVENRLKDNTILGRFRQYGVTIEAIYNHPVGLFNYENPDYYKLMNKHDMLIWHRDKNNNPCTKALEVHNGYLSVGMMYGAPGVAAFLLLLFSAYRYFKRLTKKSFEYTIPLFGIIIWGLSNLTQRNDDFQFYYVMLMAMIIGAFVGLPPKHSINKALETP